EARERSNQDLRREADLLVPVPFGVGSGKSSVSLRLTTSSNVEVAVRVTPRILASRVVRNCNNSALDGNTALTRMSYSPVVMPTKYTSGTLASSSATARILEGCPWISMIAQL